LGGLACQGKLDYHTTLTLAGARLRRCPVDVRPNIRSGESSSNTGAQALQYRRRQHSDKDELTGEKKQYCLNAALNYTSGSPVSSLQQFLVRQGSAQAERQIANPEELSRYAPNANYFRQRSERVSRSADLQKAFQEALLLMRSYQERSAESCNRN